MISSASAHVLKFMLVLLLFTASQVETTTVRLTNRDKRKHAGVICPPDDSNLMRIPPGEYLQWETTDSKLRCSIIKLRNRDLDSGTFTLFEAGDTKMVEASENNNGICSWEVMKRSVALHDASRRSYPKKFKLKRVDMDDYCKQHPELNNKPQQLFNFLTGLGHAPAAN